MSRFREKMNLLQGKKADSNANHQLHVSHNDEAIGRTDDMESLDSFVQAAYVDHIAASHSNEAHVEGNQVYLDQDIRAIVEDSYAHKWNEQGIGLYYNEFGSFLLKRKRYANSYYHGMHQLKQFKQIAAHLARFHPEQEGQAFQAEQILFLDLETTGLGTGAGNIPFMVGLAYMKQDEFIVEQAVIRHAGEERAMLAYLHRLTSSFSSLVTYNGKTFDWPLLHSRYVMNGMREEIWQPLHIDLLHPSRAIWRNTLESCRLSHIEEMRLGIIRKDDLPGSEAPERYFKYLNDFDPEHLFPVYLHNEIDMLSLITLTIRFGFLLSDENIMPYVQHPTEPEEMVRTGLWLEKMGLNTYSEQLYSLATHVPAAASSTLMLLSMRDKQAGHIDRAIMLWEKIVQHDRISAYKYKVEAAIQLAMYYEHKAKDLLASVEYTELAYKQLLHQLELNHSQKSVQKKLREQLMEIDKRLQRLLKKLAKQKQYKSE